MPRQSASVVENSFVTGLVTETTALKFPANACTETYNCVFSHIGAVHRRLGFDLEVGFTQDLTIAQDFDNAFTEYLWTTAGGDGQKNFLVVQEGPNLHFYNMGTSTDVGVNRHPFAVTLATYAPTGSTMVPRIYPCQYAQGNGKLIIVNPAINPIVIKYDVVTDILSVLNDGGEQGIELTIRDFEGVADGLAPGARPVTTVLGLTVSNPSHYYNLINQGWYSGGDWGGAFGSGGTTGGGSAHVLSQWDVNRTDVPSNIDYPSLYRKDDVTDFEAARVTNKTPGSAPAPKGHFVLNVGKPDRNAALAGDGFANGVVPASYSTFQRPSTVCFMAGRVFYAGINYSVLSNNIYFTQIIEKDDQYAKCYQLNDPTSEWLSDLLPSDGGVIRIPEMGSVQKLFAYRTSLIVIANNGVWIVTGGTSQGFAANDYAVKKISSIGSTSPMSVVDYQGVPIWWAEDGIYTVGYDAQNDSFSLQTLSYDTVRSFQLAIPEFNRSFVKGAYDILNYQVFWLYNDAPSFSSPSDRYKYNKILVFNPTTKAFYPWTISSGGPDVRGVVYLMAGDRTDQSVIKYVVTYLASTTLYLNYAECYKTDYLDWGFFFPDTSPGGVFDGFLLEDGISAIELEDGSSDLLLESDGAVSGIGVDYSSYFITGYRLDAGATRFFQSNYVHVFAEPETNGSCFMQGLWDFTNTGSSGKWSTRQQIYNANITERVLDFRRLKVRGKGRALQLKFVSETGKPFTIVGWGLFESANASV